MRVLICGSRTWDDPYPISQVVRALPASSVVITGSAPGADTLAYRSARRQMFHVEEYPANWARDGKAAGPIRNQRMLDLGKPTIVWAFVDKPLSESRGTADMVRRATQAGIPTYVVEKAT